MDGILQGSPEWKTMRLGKVTGSRVFDAVDRDAKGAFRASRENLIYELAMEDITGTSAEAYVSQAMRDGTEREPVARTLFEFETGHAVREIAFVDHPTIRRCGFSPDGLIDEENAFIEIKCPQVKTHFEYLLTETVPKKYMAQIVHGFSCMPERTHCYFVSYNPQAPEQARLFIKRVERNNSVVKAHEDMVMTLVNAVESKIEEINAILDQRV